MSLERTLRWAHWTVEMALEWHLLGCPRQWRLQWVHMEATGRVRVYRGKGAAVRAREAYARRGGMLFQVVRRGIRRAWGVRRRYSLDGWTADVGLGKRVVRLHAMDMRSWPGFDDFDDDAKVTAVARAKR